MKEINRKGGKCLKKKNLGIIIIGGLVLILLSGLFFAWKKTDLQDERSSILQRIYDYNGYVRVISQEEYDFYEYLVKRDLPDDTTEKEVEERVKAYANEVNATFYLGNKLGYCEPYSYEVLQLRMEQENAKRQAQKENNEVIYGVEKFQSLTIYFQYMLDNVQASIRGYLEENADDEILEMAESYYEEHKEAFQSVTQIVYEQTVDGVTETITADAEDLSFYGKADAGLADFLGAAQIGDAYEDDHNGQARSVIVKDITYTEYGYENHEYMALYQLVRYELYDMVIERVAKNNPVEFE